MESLDRRSLIAGVVVGVVLGLLLGALIFYVLWPVEVTGLQSYHLSPEAKAEYIGLVAESYMLDRDHARVSKYLELWKPEEEAQAVANAKDMYSAEPDKVQAIDDLALVLGISEVSPSEFEEEHSLWERVRPMCLVFFLVLLVLVLAWIGFRFAVQRRRAAAGEAAPMAQPVSPLARIEDWEGVGQPPLGHFFTTYQLGEDTYDESFSIETPMGEFLGECGVGISETVGVGDPDKVTAFEVWLFDKSDIRTVTKVLMSDYAFNDDALRAKLASKGEAVLAQPGSPFALETSSLQVRVDVTELLYGEGDLASQSFFSKLTIELVATAKPAGIADSAF
jgi:hypothetical protein